MKNVVSYLRESGKIIQSESWSFPTDPLDNDEVGYLVFENQVDVSNSFVKNGQLLEIPLPKPSEWHMWDGVLEQWVDRKPQLVITQEQRTERESTYNFKGHDFQVDEKSIGYIGNRALKIVKRKLLEEEIEPILWRLKDNTFYTFDADEFLTFAEAVDVYVESVMKEKWDEKDTVSGMP